MDGRGGNPPVLTRVFKKRKYLSTPEQESATPWGEEKPWTAALR